MDEVGYPDRRLMVMLRNVVFNAMVDGATLEDVNAAVTDAARMYRDRVGAAAKPPLRLAAR